MRNIIASKDNKIDELIEKKAIKFRDEINQITISLKRSENFIRNFEDKFNMILPEKIDARISEAGTTYLPAMVLQNAHKCDTKTLNELAIAIQSIIHESNEEPIKQTINDKSVENLNQTQKIKTVKIVKKANNELVY